MRDQVIGPTSEGNKQLRLLSFLDMQTTLRSVVLQMSALKEEGEPAFFSNGAVLQNEFGHADWLVHSGGLHQLRLPLVEERRKRAQMCRVEHLSTEIAEFYGRQNIFFC